MSNEFANVYVLRIAVSVGSNTINKCLIKTNCFAFCFCTFAISPFEGVKLGKIHYSFRKLI